LKDENLRKALGNIISKLSNLRATFDKYVESGEFQISRLGGEDYLHYPPEDAASEIDNLKNQVLEDFRKTYPPFDLKTSIY
jgi:hypothetical protein